MDEIEQAAPGMAKVYGELRGALLAFLRKHTDDAQAAEDLLHDVVVKALATGRAPLRALSRRCAPSARRPCSGTDAIRAPVWAGRPWSLGGPAAA